MFTKENLFNLIAPIHIYHKADLRYKKEANKAYRILKQKMQEPVVSQYFGEMLFELKKRSVDQVDYTVFWKIYDQLFEEIVTDAFPELKPDYDFYGAKCFVANGRKYLDGDSYHCYPFYLYYSSLKNRLLRLRDELYA